MLSPRAMTIPGIGGTWVIARVRPKAEKDFAADLLRDWHERGFDYFLPLKRRVTTSVRTTREHWTPLPQLVRCVFCASQVPPIPGYNVPTELFYFLKDHPSVYGMVEVPPSQQETLVGEMSEILHGIRVNYNHTDEEFVKPSRNIRVKKGAFMGREGEIDAVGKRGRVKVPITLFGRVVELDVPASELEPAN